MSLIYLQHIKSVYFEARHNRDLAIRQSFNLPEDEAGLSPKIPEDLFVRLIKTHAQAKVIYKQLKRLHKVCTDFAAGNFQPYIDKHTKNQEKYVVNPENRSEYQPLVEIDVAFNEGIDYPLPRTIEQYSELLDLCRELTEIRKLSRDGLNKFFGNEPTYYEVLDKEGEKVILPAGELPEDYVNEQSALSDVRSIQAEYSLDNYNAFYQQALALYQESHETGDITKCAQGILSLYAPLK